MILRDRDADNTGGWAGSPDGTLEERTYYVQNWRADVVALLTDAGQLIQQVRYDPYGVPFGISKTDLDANGLVNLLDYSRWLTLYDNGNGTHPYADWNWDGTVDSSDESAFLADRSNDTSLGRGVLGYGFDRTGGNNRKGYAGYEEAVELEGAKPGTYHVRHRVYLAELGRWTKRDPIGYVDGANLYRYASISPLVLYDPMGLRECRSGCGDGDGDGGGGGGGGDRGTLPPKGYIAVVPGPTPGSPFAPSLLDGSCFWLYVAMGTACELKYRAGTLERAWCMEAAHAAFQVCNAARNLPTDLVTISRCWSTLTPAPPSLALCSRYGVCDSHHGVNFRCMCNCMGNGPWENDMRTCIRCGISNGANSYTVHEECWRRALKKYGAVPARKLMGCGALCLIAQQTLCGPGLETY